MQYAYEAVGKSGRVVRGSLAAPSVEILQAQLDKDGLALINVRPDLLGNLKLLAGSRKVKRNLLIELFGYLYGLMAMGLDTMAIWRSVEESIPNPTVTKAVQSIRTSIDQGYPLAEAMARTEAFPALVLGSVRAGEASGALEKVFRSLEQHYREEQELAQQTWKATLYPLISIIVLFAIGVGLLIGVVPELKQIFPANPPAPTRVLVFLSDGAVNYWWTIPGSVAAAVIGWGRMPETSRSRVVEKLYGVWVIGPLLKNVELTQVFFNFSLMLSAGVSVLPAFETVIPTTRSIALRTRLKSVADMISKGGRFSDGFRDPFFPSIIASALSQGETTGALDVYLGRIATFPRDRTKARLQVMSTLIEPLLLLVGGGMVLFLALGIFMPIYGQLQKMRH